MVSTFTGVRPPGIDDPAWIASAAAERAALLAALDGARVAPGPAGAPARGRRDVLPTGRNLVHRRSAHAADTDRDGARPPRRRRSRARASADARRHAARSGDRSLGQRDARAPAARRSRKVWRCWAAGRSGKSPAAASPALKCCPARRWAAPRVDVTWRISGLFRDLFPAQIALIDAAVQAVAARDETADENPLAATRHARRQARLASHFRHRARRLWRGRRGFDRPAMPMTTPSALPISPPPRMPTAAPTARRMPRPALLRSASPAPTRWCMSATIRRAIFWRAPRMPLSSAVSPRRRSFSAVRSIW